MSFKKSDILALPDRNPIKQAYLKSCQDNHRRQETRQESISTPSINADQIGLGCVFFSIPFCMPSLNSLLRWHWSRRKRFRASLAAFIPTQEERAKIKMNIIYRQYRWSLLDPDNLRASCKELTDAIADHCLIYDDSVKWLSCEWSQEIDRQNRRTEITITGGNYDL